MNQFCDKSKLHFLSIYKLDGSGLIDTCMSNTVLLIFIMKATIIPTHRCMYYDTLQNLNFDALKIALKPLLYQDFLHI